MYYGSVWNKNEDCRKQLKKRKITTSKHLNSTTFYLSHVSTHTRSLNQYVYSLLWAQGFKLAAQDGLRWSIWNRVPGSKARSTNRRSYWAALMSARIEHMRLHSKAQISRKRVIILTKTFQFMKMRAFTLTISDSHWQFSLKKKFFSPVITIFKIEVFIIFFQCTTNHSQNIDQLPLHCF